MKSNIDDDSKIIIRNIALKQWKSAANSLFKHENVKPELILKIENDVKKELSEYCRLDNSILRRVEPDQLATFSNKVFMHKIETNCPLFSTN